MYYHSQVLFCFAVTLETFSAVEINGETLLPLSKTSSKSSGYDPEFGAFYRETTNDVSKENLLFN